MLSFVNQLLIEQRPLCGRRLSTEEASPACHFIFRLMWLSPVAKSAVDSLHGDPMIRRGNVPSPSETWFRGMSVGRSFRRV